MHASNIQIYRRILRTGKLCEKSQGLLLKCYQEADIFSIVDFTKSKGELLSAAAREKMVANVGW
ncbi:hypothetical protein AUC60_21300 [Pseudomonas caspiana]|uniref:Uncharacterized protein n=1 Tax=Pseudomonas caspiana TaxID=1451454 RepID=A0A1Y3P511_9PSED|nr:hypothetical protein AUC60_21300 [Pseudomonas caspiana]